MLVKRLQILRLKNELALRLTEEHLSDRAKELHHLSDGAEMMPKVMMPKDLNEADEH